MGKVWVLDTETKGTGANMRPLDKLVEPPPRRERSARRPAKPSRPAAPRSTGGRAEPERTTTALPPGHVRKKATGEIGRVQSVDARAGTATVRWLKGGSTSTVPLSVISTR